MQNRYAREDLVTALGNLGISNRAVTVSGRATRSQKGSTEEEFVQADPEAIRATLTTFLDKHALPRADDLVILDMEPTGFAPRSLGFFEGKRQRDLIAAYRRRIRVARQVLRQTGLAGLKLGLYQVVVPDGKGRATDEFEQRMGGYVRAGELGLYDQLDVICPVLYQRFGSEDAKPETVLRWIAAASRQGIEESLTLTRRNGSRIPLAPILSFWVFNGRSANNRQAVPSNTVARQLQVVQRSLGVDSIVFWSAWQTREEMESAAKPVEAIDIDDFLLSVGRLPWPGCT